MGSADATFRFLESYSYEPNGGVIRFHHGGIRDIRDFMLPVDETETSPAEDQVMEYFFGTIVAPAFLAGSAVLLTALLCCTCCCCRGWQCWKGYKCSKSMRKVSYISFMWLTSASFGVMAWLMTVAYASQVAVSDTVSQLQNVEELSSAASVTVSQLASSVNRWITIQRDFEGCATNVNTTMYQQDLRTLSLDIKEISDEINNFFDEAGPYGSTAASTYTSLALVPFIVFDILCLLVMTVFMASTTVSFFSIHSESRPKVQRQGSMKVIRSSVSGTTGCCAGLLLAGVSLVLWLFCSMLLVVGTLGGDLCIDPDTALQRGIATGENLSYMYVQRDTGACEVKPVFPELDFRPPVAEDPNSLDLLCYYQTCTGTGNFVSKITKDIEVAANSALAENKNTPYNEFCETQASEANTQLRDVLLRTRNVIDSVSCTKLTPIYRFLFHDAFCGRVMDTLYNTFSGVMWSSGLALGAVLVYLWADLGGSQLYLQDSSGHGTYSSSTYKPATRSDSVPEAVADHPVYAEPVLAEATPVEEETVPLRSYVVTQV